MKKKSAQTALLLIDFINLFDFDNADKLAPSAISAALATARLKARAHDKGVPCIYANDNFGQWTAGFPALTDFCSRKPGAPGKLATLLRPGKKDLSILKPRHSAFYGTPLEFLLDELNASKLIITGLTADICVFATAQDAYMRKFGVWVPSNCVAAFSPAQKQASLSHMARTLKARTTAAQAATPFSWPLR